MAQEGLVLTEKAQLAALEKAKAEKENPWRIRQQMPGLFAVPRTPSMSAR